MANVHLDLKPKGESIRETGSEKKSILASGKKENQLLWLLGVVKKVKTQYLPILLILYDTSEKVAGRRI